MRDQTETPMPDIAITADNSREQFLLEMYKQMWANINRHILVVCNR